MKLIRTLEITSDEFFDHLECELIEMANKAGKKIKLTDIKKGLKYNIRNESKYTNCEITLMEYERDYIYKSRIKSLEDTITLSYRIEKDPKGIKVTFDQNIASFENKKQNRLMKGWSEAVYLGRMSDTLYDIQKKCIQKREGIVEKPKDDSNHKLLNKLLTKK